MPESMFGTSELFTTGVEEANRGFSDLVSVVEDLNSVIDKAIGSLGVGESSLVGSIVGLASASRMATSNIKQLTEAIRNIGTNSISVSSVSNRTSGSSRASSSRGLSPDRQYEKNRNAYMNMFSSFYSEEDIDPQLRKSMKEFFYGNNYTNQEKNTLSSRFDRLGLGTQKNIIETIKEVEEKAGISGGILSDPKKASMVLGIFGKYGASTADKALNDNGKNKVEKLLKDIIQANKDNTKYLTQLDKHLSTKSGEFSERKNLTAKLGGALLTSGLSLGAIASDKYLINTPDNAVGSANRTQSMIETAGTIIGGIVGSAIPLFGTFEGGVVGRVISSKVGSVVSGLVGSAVGHTAGSFGGKYLSTSQMSKVLFGKDYGFTSNLSADQLMGLKYSANLNTLQGNQFGLAKNVGKGLLSARLNNVFGDAMLSSSQEQQLIGSLTTYAKAGTLTGSDLGDLAKNGLTLSQINDISSNLYSSSSYSLDSKGTINRYASITRRSGQLAGNAFVGYQNQDYKGKHRTDAFAQSAFGMSMKDALNLANTKSGLSQLHNTAVARLGGAGKTPLEREDIAKMQLNQFGNSQVLGLFNAGSSTGSGNVEDAKNLSQQMVDYLKQIKDLLSASSISTFAEREINLMKHFFHHDIL